MNGYNFTERVREVLRLARDQSHAFNHEYIGTEHLLLGLIKEGEGLGVAVLRNLNVDLDKIREETARVVQKGKVTQPRDDLPFTSRAKKVLELSMIEARDLHHNHVGTEHVMLGLIREEKGIAAQILHQAGVTTQSARDEVLRLLGSPTQSGRPPAFGAQAMFPSPDHSAADASSAGLVIIDILFGNGSAIRRSFSDIGEAIEFLQGHQNRNPKG